MTVRDDRGAPALRDDCRYVCAMKSLRLVPGAYRRLRRDLQRLPKE